METTLLSLFVILVVTAIAPFLASLVPGRAVPEVVFLVFAGALLGPYGANLVSNEGLAMQTLSDLGLGFLFLMAGYEIDPRELLGHQGRVASASWFVSLGLGFAFVALVFSHLGFERSSWPAMALLMTTTAYGTLAPIMRDRNLGPTRVGKAVVAYGSTGELLPVVAMSLMLSGRTLSRSLVVLGVFLAVCVVVLVFSMTLKRIGGRFWTFVTQSAGPSSHAMMRLVTAILVLLLLAAEFFSMDAVLGAFAAGFILRALFPEGNEVMERNLHVVGAGLFQPIFFVVSGAGIDLGAAASNLPVLFGFIGALVLVRGVVVGISLKVDPQTRDMGWREVLSASAYCTMALPLVVAITGVAVGNGVMLDSTASVLVTSGALTVLLVPALTSLVHAADESGVADISQELAQGDQTVREVLHRHNEEWHQAHHAYLEQRARRRSQGTYLSAADFYALSGGMSGYVPRKGLDLHDRRGHGGHGGRGKPAAEHGGQAHGDVRATEGIGAEGRSDS
jgi:Kef-type K+ transport system membrane component KefB